MAKDSPIQTEYFKWICNLVTGKTSFTPLSYKKILYFLYCKNFVSLMRMDDNRYNDGIEFRFHFGYENGYSWQYIDENLNLTSCSMLEMMVALAYRVENQIEENDIYGDRTGQWFWTMMTNLGLSDMDDLHFDPAKADKIVDRFLAREYCYNGEGGLFMIEDPKEDLRTVDIWCQFMWYLTKYDL